MLDWKTLHDDIIVPTLKHLGTDSAAARRLVLGTAVHESTIRDITYLKQQGGPALGIYQIEPATAQDTWVNYLRYHPEMRRKVEDLIAPYPEQDAQLQSNLVYATAICRLIYYRRKEALPADKDEAGLAMYWKNFYNTSLGKGSPKDWLEHFALVRTIC